MQNYTLPNSIEDCHAMLHQFIALTRHQTAQLEAQGLRIQSEVVHFDKSDVKINKTLHWLHTTLNFGLLKFMNFCNYLGSTSFSS